MPKHLKLEFHKTIVGNDRLMLTEVVKSSNSKAFFSNSEILYELHKLQTYLDSQLKILSNIIKKLNKKNLVD